ncbi:MAG TPA: F0F1 ATP synthase subunit epsilon [Acidimicrobiia bacterium]|nr:F0F1 ATP synthase subunit epsilon [Acidimicrobiia bacterium]
MPLQVELVSPERVLYSGEADMVVARTTDGELAFLPGHAPFLGALAIAKVRVILTGGGEEVAAVHGGFVEVRDNKVTILSDVAELQSQIDVERARKAQHDAEERARTETDAEVQAALARATVRIDVAGL